jgi:hypothetical protein
MTAPDALATRPFAFETHGLVVELNLDSRGLWLWRAQHGTAAGALFPAYSAIGYFTQDQAFSAAERAITSRLCC